MSDLLGLSEGVKGLSSGLDSARDAGKTVSKQIENIQKDAVDVALIACIEQNRTVCGNPVSLINQIAHR